MPCFRMGRGRIRVPCSVILRPVQRDLHPAWNDLRPAWKNLRPVWEWRDSAGAAEERAVEG